MALNFHPRLLIIFALLVVAHCSNIPSSTGDAGQFFPVDPKDEKVIEIAKFAVRKHNQQANANLVLKTVISAYKQIVAGANYRIVLTAKHGDSASNYSALVYENLSGHKTLRDFKPLLGQNIPPYVPVDPSDPHVIEIAKFAVDKRNQVADSNLVFKTVLSAEKQIVSGTNYRIGLTAKDGNVEANFSAIVYENLSAQKCLEEFKRLIG